MFEGLSEVIINRVSKNGIVLTSEAEMVGHTRDAPEGKQTLGGSIKVPWMYSFFGSKKNKTESKNELKSSL